MFERSELRSRGEERMENGVKNLKRARLFPKTFSNNGNGDAYFTKFFLIIEKLKSNMKKEKGDYFNAIRREVHIFLNFSANLF